MGTLMYRLFSVFLFLIPLIVFSYPDSLQTYNSSDSIVVVANRYRGSLKSMAYNRQVITGNDLEAITTHSVLESIDLSNPSAYVMDKKVLGYGVGTAGSGFMNIRGLGGRINTGVLILIDGHPDAMSLFGHPLPDVYGNETISRVEILSGAASTLFGSHALGGVVNLMTQDFDGNRIIFHSELGTFHTKLLNVNVRQHIRNQTFLASFGYNDSDGHLPQSGFTSKRFQMGWRYRLSPHWEVRAQGRYVPYSFDDPSRGDTDLLKLHAYADIRRGMAQIIVRHWHGLLTGSAQLYGNWGKHRFYDGFQSEDRTLGFSGYQQYTFNKRFFVSSGWDAMRLYGKAHNDFATLPNGKPVVNPSAHQMTSFGLYIVGFYSPFSYLHIRGGERYQYNSLGISTFSPLLGITLNLTSQINVFANYSNGFRTPTLMELYLFPSANLDLKNEQVDSYDAGVRYHWSERLTFRMSLFRNQVQNLIEATPVAAPPPPARFENSGSARQWGMELLTKITLPFHSRLQLSYAYLNPDQLTAFNPRHQFKYQLFIRYPWAGFAVYGKYIGRLYADNQSRKPLNDYHVLNSTIRFGKENLHLYFKVLNVLNRQYNVLPGYPAPGRQMRIGLKVIY